MNKRSLVMLCLLLAALSAQAQEPGRLTGAVVEARSGRPLPGLNVVVAGTLHGAVTDAEGRFEVGPVPPGVYTVQVNALGYRPESQTVAVAAGTATVVDFRLRLPEVELEDVESVVLRHDLQPVVDLSAQRIREVNVLDAGALLRALPGVDAARRGGHSLHPSIRGLSENQIGVYVDGIRFLPGSPYGIGTPLGYFDPRAVERVEVVKGPYALTWGAGNLGALWVETRGANPVRRLRASVQGGYTSNVGGYEAAGAISGGVADLSYWMQGVYRAAGDYGDGGGRVVPADFRAAEARGQFAYRLASATRLTVLAGYQDQRDVDAPGRLLDARSADAANVSGRFQTAWAAGLVRVLDVTAYWNRLSQELDDEERSGDGTRDVVEADHRQVGGRLAARLAPVEGLVLEAGGDVYNARYDAVRGLTTREAVLPDARVTDVGVFANGTRAFGRVEASATLRVDFVRADADEAFDAPGTGETSLSGAFSLSTRLSPLWRLSAGLGSVMRTADAVERYARRIPLRSTHLVAEVQGNPSLAPERGTQADVWLEASYPRLDMRLNGFVRRLDDYITLSATHLDSMEPPDPEAPTNRYVNGAATFWGLEAAGTYALYPRFVTLEAAASYLWGQDGTLGEAAPGIAPLSGSLGWRLQAPANLFFLEGTLRGIAAQNRVAASRGEPSTGGYVTADVHLGMSLPRSSYLLVGLDNLTDVAYADHLNALDPFTQVRLAEPGRTFFARFRIAY